MRTIFFTTICFSLYGLLRAGPTCMRCTDVADISECFTNVANCGDNEECYLEKVTQEDLSIKYNAGCRSKQVCAIMAALNGGNPGGRKKRALVNCAACCSDAPGKDGPCNSKLCGLSGGQTQASCLVCEGVHSDVAACSTAATCPPNEVCFTGIRIVGTFIRYVFGCYEERVCYAMLDNDNKNSTIHRPGRVIHGDQGTPICDSCCKGDKCNAADCFELRKNMTLADFSNGSVRTTRPPPTATPQPPATSPTSPATSPTSPATSPAPPATSPASPSTAATPATPTASKPASTSSSATG